MTAPKNSRATITNLLSRALKPQQKVHNDIQDVTDRSAPSIIIIVDTTQQHSPIHDHQVLNRVPAVYRKLSKNKYHHLLVVPRFSPQTIGASVAGWDRQSYREGPVVVHSVAKQDNPITRSKRFWLPIAKVLLPSASAKNLELQQLFYFRRFKGELLLLLLRNC